uniref:Uncharacterized protein n=1 Tax=Arundo donax TaxID=35708 RepID=A0A0A9APG6_ARUDO
MGRGGNFGPFWCRRAFRPCHCIVFLFHWLLLPLFGPSKWAFRTFFPMTSSPTRSALMFAPKYLWLLLPFPPDSRQLLILSLLDLPVDLFVIGASKSCGTLILGHCNLSINDSTILHMQP